MKKIHPKDFVSVKPYDMMTVVPKGEQQCWAVILYVQARKNFFYDKKGNITEEFEMVAHRIGFEPLSGEHNGRLVDSVHCSVGLFELFEPYEE